MIVAVVRRENSVAETGNIATHVAAYANARNVGIVSTLTDLMLEEKGSRT
jgi:hypothetical protein